MTAKHLEYLKKYSVMLYISVERAITLIICVNYYQADVRLFYSKQKAIDILLFKNQMLSDSLRPFKSLSTLIP